jgi:hypothetical protein
MERRWEYIKESNLILTIWIWLGTALSIYGVGICTLIVHGSVLYPFIIMWSTMTFLSMLLTFWIYYSFDELILNIWLFFLSCVVVPIAANGLLYILFF